MTLGSAHRRDLYLTTYDSLEETDIHGLAGLELANPATKRPQNHVLDPVGTDIS